MDMGRHRWLLIAAVGVLVGTAQAQKAGELPPGAIATVNGQPITRGELVQFLASRYGAVGVQQLLTDRLVEKELEQKGLAVTPEEVEALAAQLIAQHRGEAAYKRTLQRRGVTLAYVKTYELPLEIGFKKLGDLLLPTAASNADLLTVLVEQRGAATDSQLVLLHLLEEELKRQGLTVSETEIEKGLADWAARSGGREAFDAALRRSGVTLASFKTHKLRPELALTKLAEKLKDKVSTDKVLVREFERRYRDQAQRQLMLYYLFSQELPRRGLSVTKEDIEELLAERVARAGGRQAFDEAIRREDVTLDHVKAYRLIPEARQRKLTEALRGEVITKEARAAYLVGRFGAKAAQQLQMMRLVREELGRQGLTVSDTDVDALLAKRTAEAGGRDVYLRLLRTTGVTLEYVKTVELTTEISLSKLADRLKDTLTADAAFGDLLVARYGRRAVQQLVMLQLLTQELDRRGMEVTDGDVNALLSKRYETNGGRDAYTERLKRLGISLAYVTTYELVAEAAQRKLVAANVIVADEEVKRLFTAQFGEQREIRRIIVDNVLVANDVRTQLNGGADFATLARRHSLDPQGRAVGGRWQAFGRGGLPPMLKAVELEAFKLEVGKHSGVIGVGRYFHIIKLERIIPPRSDVTFEQEKEKLREAISRKKLAAHSKALLTTLHQKAKIVIQPDLTGG